MFRKIKVNTFSENVMFILVVSHVDLDGELVVVIHEVGLGHGHGAGALAVIQ